MEHPPHLRELSHRHRRIDSAIFDEKKRPSFEMLRLRQLKSEKLGLHDEMDSLKTGDPADPD